MKTNKTFIKQLTWSTSAVSLACMAFGRCSRKPEYSIAVLLPPLETLEERTIAQDLAEFRFSSDPDNLDFAFLNKGRGDDGDGDASSASYRMFVRGHLGDNDDAFAGFDDVGANDDFADGGIQDFFTGDQAPADDIPAGGPAGFAPFGVDDSEEPAGVAVGGMEPFDPRRAPNERDLVMAMGADDDQEEMLDYFDSAFMKNWAGPEHWKLRRAVKKRMPNNCKNLSIAVF
jgi:condensin complex subunit 2